jgi:hypothetical protein
MLHVLTESESEAALLARILEAEHRAGAVESRRAAPPSSLYSAARTLLAVRNEPVAVLLDAGSTAPEAADRRRLAAEEVIGEAAGAAPSRILVAVPALEALLFRRPDALARAYGTISPGLLELGRVSPRDALEKLDPSGSASRASCDIIRALDDHDIAALRAESPIRDLLEFLGESQRRGAATAAAP